MPTHIFPLNAQNSSYFDTDDRIFLGEGIFETIKVENKRPLYPSPHWQRMRAAAHVLQIPFNVSNTVWQESLGQCILETKLQSGGVKVTLSGGCAARGLAAHSDLSCLLFKAFLYKSETVLCTLVSVSWTRDSKNPVYQIKSVNYLENILARRQALSLGADDALFFNTEGHATETTVANLFMIKDGHLFTPRIEDGVLGGVIRNQLLSLSRAAGIVCHEMSITKQTLFQAELLFVTNALNGLRVITSLDGFPLPTVHPMLNSLQELLNRDSGRWS
jgi:4-amino-4-deoxychorismate lyase